MADQDTTGQDAKPGTDVAKRGGLTAFIERYQGDFAAVVPDHVPVEAFVGLAAAQVRRDKYLRDAATVNPGSLIIALRECAALGHLPVKGTASLVPFRDKNAPGGWTVTLIEEVGGVIERMYRAGGVVSVHSELVRQNDEFTYQRMGLPHHVWDVFASPDERGPLVGVYAWAEMIGGNLSQVVFLNRHEIARARSMSASGKKAGGGNFWGPEWPHEGPNTAAMWRKTAYHRLERIVPTSPSYLWQLGKSAAAGEAGSRFRGVPDAPTRAAYADAGADVVDAEILDEGRSAGASATPGEEWPEAARPPDAP